MKEKSIPGKLSKEKSLWGIEGVKEEEALVLSVAKERNFDLIVLPGQSYLSVALAGQAWNRINLTHIYHRPSIFSNGGREASRPVYLVGHALISDFLRG